MEAFIHGETRLKETGYASLPANGTGEQRWRNFTLRNALSALALAQMMAASDASHAMAKAHCLSGANHDPPNETRPHL